MRIDLAGFISDVKAHAAEHGFHIHDERHFIESYSLFQHWEVDVHPVEACMGPMEMQIVLEADPRPLLAFEDLAGQEDWEQDDLNSDSFQLPLYFKWALPPLTRPPDLLILSTDIVGVSGTIIPITVLATDTMSATDPATRSLSLVGEINLSLRDIFMRETELCEVLDCAHRVSAWILEQAEEWLEDADPISG